jgi:hypothetical protein
VLRRWTARTIVACEVDVDSGFDQTPGPSAGAPMNVGQR